VKLPDQLKHPTAISYLNKNGAWVRQPFEESGDSITVERTLGSGEPVCLLLR